jgi:hypothetical protein
MYLIGPLELSFLEVLAISAATVIALAAAEKFVPRHAKTSRRSALGLLWLFGVYAALRGGYEPGLGHPITSYPWARVLLTVSLITVESLALCFILCYRNRGPSIRTLAVATVIFVLLAVLDLPPTDQPGYAYANSNFLVLTAFILVAGLVVRMMASGEGCKSRFFESSTRNAGVRGRFSWQRGFGAFSYSRSQVSTVAKYIRKSGATSRERSFRNEYITLLNRFDVEYDPQYLFTFIEDAGDCYAVRMCVRSLSGGERSAVPE